MGMSSIVCASMAIFAGVLLLTSTAVWNDTTVTIIFAIITKFIGITTILTGIKVFVREDLFPDYMVIPKLGDD